MSELRAFPEEIQEIFEILKSEISLLDVRWRIFKELYVLSSERIDLLNKSAAAYFRITHDVFIDDIFIRIRRLIDVPESKGNKNLSLGQIQASLDSEKYQELIRQLTDQLDNIQTLNRPIKNQRNKNIAHSDFNIALRRTSPVESVTFESIEQTLVAIRNFMNECELYFLGTTTEYEGYAIGTGGRSLTTKLKKAVAYDELEAQGLIEKDYWKEKSQYRDA